MVGVRAMRRRSLLLLAAGLLGCLGLVALVAVPRLVGLRPGVTVANFRRLHYQMSQARVEAILGGPGHERYAGGQLHRTDWDGDGCHVTVWFLEVGTDGTGRVAELAELTSADGRWEPLAPEPPSWLDQIRGL